MTRIYEALEQFDLEQSGIAKRPFTVPQINITDSTLDPGLTETLIGLYRTIFTVVPGARGRIVQFVESGKDNSCSKIIRAFAKVSSDTLKKSVLLLDSDPQRPSDFDFFNQQSRINWVEKIEQNGKPITSSETRNNRLFSVSRLSMESGVLPVDLEPEQTEEFMLRLKNTFDLTLIDSWSISAPPKPMLFSPHVDGVVLVVDSGKTRWQIAEKQKKEIVAQGGNVLGVILNNRTYPIPESIYNRL